MGSTRGAVRFVALTLSALTLVSCGMHLGQPESLPTRSVADSAARIEGMLHGLRPRVEVVNAPPVRWSLTERMAAYKVPGVSIAIIDGGRLVWAKGFGVKEAGGRDSITATTIFQAASISKPIAASAMLRLVERGKLSLDTNVNRYLTSWQLPENHFTQHVPVTLRRLASHSGATSVSGFPGYKVGDSLPTIPELLDGKVPANTKPVRVDTLPGARFAYSGGGTTIMQQLLVDVTGTPFPALLRELVLGPVGMRHSTYEQPLPAARVADAARAHDRSGTMIPGRWHVYPEMAAAGLWTTPSDLARWAIAIADARAGRSTKFLSQTTAMQMFTGIRGRTPQERVGLGIFLYGTGERRSFGHGGENLGFLNQLIMYPGTGQGAVIMTNGNNGQPLLQEILYAIGAEFGWPADGPTKVETVAVDSAALGPLAGEYSLDIPGRHSTIRIVREGNHLFFHGSWAILREELHPLSPMSFVASGTGRRVIFSRDAAGRTVLSLEMSQGLTLTGTRQ